MVNLVKLQSIDTLPSDGNVYLSMTFSDKREDFVWGQIFVRELIKG
jgi:hypothetical protein